MRLKTINASFAFYLFFAGLCLLTVPAAVRAADDPNKCDPKTITFIARDEGGKTISDISFAVYTQIVDADNNPKPGANKASGKTSSITGFGVVSFTDKENSSYALKIWDKNANAGAFYFYNAVNAGCGQAVTVTEKLSGFDFILRDADRKLIKNASFSVYTQKYDADDNPIKQKDSLVASLNTGDQGEAFLYAANSSRSLDGRGNYAIEIKNSNNGVYNIYGESLADGEITMLDYILSDMRIELKDSAGIPYPANTKFEVYEQKLDNAGNNSLGTKIKDLILDDYGVGILQYPEGTYVGRIKNSDGTYDYFYNLRITDGGRKTYQLSSKKASETVQESCGKTSKLSFILKDFSGDSIPGLHYEVFEQKSDASGRQVVGTSIKNGVIDNSGKASFVFSPNPLKKYAVKIYDKNATVGAFWFMNELQFSCGQDKEFVKILPALNFILRDGNGNLKKNFKFSLSTQKSDADGQPIKDKKDLISNGLTTAEDGTAKIYVAPGNLLVLSAPGGNQAEFNEYNIVSELQDTVFTYTFSDAVFEVRNSAGVPLAGATLELHEQAANLKGEKSFGKSLASVKLDDEGLGRIEYPGGIYTAMVKDEIGQNNIFWDIIINSKERANISLTPGAARISINNGKEKTPIKSANVFSLKDDGSSRYFKNKQIKTISFSSVSLVDISLAPGNYLVSYTDENKIEYGRAFELKNDQLKEIVLSSIPSNEISPDKKFTFSQPAEKNNGKLNGYILLQVESKGEAWYVEPKSGARHYLKDGAIAYEMMRKFGIGITNSDLKKIPIGLNEKETAADADNDGLPDNMEQALGTDPNNPDSDGDGYSDGQEVRGGFNPAGAGKINTDTALAGKQKGKILLQVESKGEAWYVNPKDGKRYYMKDGQNAFSIMRFLSLGIKNSDLNKIKVGAPLN